MRRALIVLATVACAAGRARAQGTDTSAAVLGYEEASEVAFLFNSSAALRATGPTTIASGQAIDGNVAVIGGPLTIDGTVHGRVVLVNGPLTLHAGARVDGDVIVTGGAAEGADTSTVAGRVRVFAAPMRYRMQGDLIVAEEVATAADTTSSTVSWFQRWRRRHLRTRNYFTIRGGTYNRVEGLPVIAGPSIRQNTDIGQLRASALGIWRSADNFAWKADNLGYDAQLEMQWGRERGLSVGVQAMDVVAPVQAWEMRNAEVGLAAFFLHRDFRDYYNAKGARGQVRLFDGRRSSLTLSYGEERWQPRSARDPFTLLRNHDAWRPNATLDAGRFRTVDATVTYDTRNNIDDPWTGWLLSADVEHGWSPEVTLGSTSSLAREDTRTHVRYTRLFVDVARYNRVSPNSQLNVRLVAGGRVGGDPLPLERRLSLGGPGTLPGYPYAGPARGMGVLSCNRDTAVAGMPAQCERIVLGQVEYRHDFTIRLFRHRGPEGTTYGFDRQMAWVAFTDLGRGWLLGSRAGNDRYGINTFPQIDTFKSDAGIGVDARWLGVYLAKSITDSENPVRLLVRLHHRF